MLQFTYEAVDGSFSQDCTQILQNADSQDWAVTCGSRKYLVHLWVTVYPSATVPKQNYEILYWVTDYNVAPELQGASTTIWFHFREPSDLYKLELSLGLENSSTDSI